MPVSRLSATYLMPLTCITGRLTKQPRLGGRVPKTPPEVSDEKAIVSFRLAYRLTNWLKDASAKRGWSMNEYVARVLDGNRDGWSLPIMIRDILDADRKPLGMDDNAY